MDPLTRAEHDYEKLLDRLRQHGADLDASLDELTNEKKYDRLRELYAQEEQEEARRMLRDLIASTVREDVHETQEQAAALRENAEKLERAVESFEQAGEASSPASFVCGRNVDLIRTMLDLSKAALARRVNAISRPTLLNVIDGKGVRLDVLEAIADALEVPSEVLILGSTKIGVLHDIARPLDEMQALRSEILDKVGAERWYAGHLATADRTDIETLHVVGGVLETVDEKYDSRAAHAGAAVGWLWGLPPETAPNVHNELDRNLLAAVIGGWWVYRLAEVGM